MSSSEARKRCPAIVLVHVETLDENGELRATPAKTTDKVSLAR
jgi:hypothetical protein